ncbi:MAG TPA: EF-hand domain-containing protein, partial [Polyangiaceae bacterium]|nr:EF-hand domain-containing protein [Polyangiaceae bacterium]
MVHFDKDEHGVAPATRTQSDIAPRGSEGVHLVEELGNDGFTTFDVGAPDSGRWLDPLILTRTPEVETIEVGPPSGIKRSAPAPLLRHSARPVAAPSIRFSRPQAQLSHPPRTQGALHPLDEVLLDALHHAFSLHAGESEMLDVHKLQSILDLKNPLLAERLLKVFDRDGDGIISRDEFLERVRRLIYGSQTDKLLFAFRLHDINGDGKVDRGEILAMIQTSMAEENTLSLAQTPDELADLLMAEADKNRDGYLSYREFEGVVAQHPAILDMMTRCEATWIAPGVDLKRSASVHRPGWFSVLRLLQNQRGAVVILGLWLCVNAALAARAVWVYHQAGAHVFVLIARACGACINFNGALILLPVMRRLLTRVRGSKWLGKLPVDDAIQFHRLLGHTLFGLSLVHAGAHLLNYRGGQGIQAGLLGTFAGLTGLGLLMVFTLMWSMSLPLLRRTSRFELFHFTHLFYLVWFALCLVHGPVFYLWASLPLLAFVMEQVLRVARRGEGTQLTELVPLSS